VERILGLVGERLEDKQRKSGRMVERDMKMKGASLTMVKMKWRMTQTVKRITRKNSDSRSGFPMREEKEGESKGRGSLTKRTCLVDMELDEGTSV
jgi:hypothetical protein